MLRTLRPELDLILSLDPEGAPWGPKSEQWVVDRVLAIKPAVAACDSVAIWATAATTASRYQADLIAKFANGSEVVGVACHGLADAIDRGDVAAAAAAIDSAVERTPDGVTGVVLGCTHYPLVAKEISARLPEGVRLFDSARAVAAQTLRRIDALGRPAEAVPGTGTVEVFLSGRPGELPASASAFEAGQQLMAARAR